MIKNISRGEIYVADLNPYQGSEQGGIRPVVILQNDTGNYFSSTTIVASLTSHVEKKKIYQHMSLLTAEKILNMIL